MPVIIGLLGRKRSGKDTFAARLVEVHGFIRYAFADNVRQAALDLDPIIGVLPSGKLYRLCQAVSEYGWEALKDHGHWGPEIRRTLQRFGSESIRALDPDFWVRTVMAQIRADDVPAVITDVRFPNEHAAVWAAGGYTIRILRPGNDTSDTHISETALDNHRVDDEILNGGTVDNLHQRADRLAAGVLWRPDPS